MVSTDIKVWGSAKFALVPSNPFLHAPSANKEINSKNESDFYPQMVTYLTEKMNKVVVKADFMKRNDFFQKHSDSEEDENQESTQIKEQE